jgi:hypothetical protein
MKKANVVCRSYNRKAVESELLGDLNESVDPTLISLSIPFVRGFARAIMTAVLAERFERALRQRK